MNEQPKNSEVLISILLAVYNGEQYLGEAIDSILSQTYTNWELILINDCSTDSSGEIAQKYAEKDQRIHYFSMDKNSGLVPSLNFGIEQVRGKYVARLDADDVMISDRLEKQLAFMESHPEVGLVGSSVDTIDENGNFTATLHVETEHESLKRLLPKKNPFFHPSVLMRTSVLKQVGKYSPQYVYAQDYDMWIRFAQISQIANLPYSLTKYRVLATSISRKSLRRQSQYVVQLKLAAIMKGYHSCFDIIYIWRPLIYSISPNWLLQIRLEYQKARAARKKNLFYR